ncbi:MAG: hypothetical protein M1833_003783 [Piccolia ochrophora]|nr:MAG: hypothetical protein M1833_003783 [Piccolia ochrophora]
MVPQKLRTTLAPQDAPNHEAGLTRLGSRDTVLAGKPGESAPADASTIPKEKRQHAEDCLDDRIIGNKKRDSDDDYNEVDSEAGEKRTEGMDADVFSQPILSNGYIPRHPPPPEYIKVRARNKTQADFNRVFLAQELTRKDDVKDIQSPTKAASVSGATPSAGRAIWALEFSKDGKLIAAGGQDKFVRVWAVISSSDDREAHEIQESKTSVSPDGEGMRLNAPVFKADPVRVYEGHTADVLDLSWSKNNFLLSSSMDKTVRLWHVSRQECLCCFKHSDFVTSISFHPRDDRFFLAGSLDSKLRLWSIPDKEVAFWNQLPDLVTAVAFTPDGKTAVAGCLNGLCLFYETEGLKYNTQIHVRSTHGRNAKGSKITGIQTMIYPSGDTNGETKLLITSNDSRVRLYNLRDKSLEMKFRGNENACSQIHASFSDDARYVICGSEDRKVYIWSTGPAEGEKKDKRPVEMFAAHSAIVTTTVLAPTKTRKLLGGSSDPLYDICNPPPVRLLGRTESQTSSRPTEADHGQSEFSNPPKQNSTSESPPKHDLTPVPEESPGYIARSGHPEGNIIVTADYTGSIKVFRQDCAFSKRRTDLWETSSFSKKLSLNRSPSVSTRTSTKSRTQTTGPVPARGVGPSDRILSWRNSISGSVASLDTASLRGASLRAADDSGRTRSTSPQTNFTSAKLPRSSTTGHTPLATTITTAATTPSITTTSPRDSTTSPPLSTSDPSSPQNSADPLLLSETGQSFTYWQTQNGGNWGLGLSGAGVPGGGRPHADQGMLGAELARRDTMASALSSDEDSSESREASRVRRETGVGDGEELRCEKCRGRRFRSRVGVGGKGRELVCLECGTVT